jgi:hypothetical protein
VADTSWAGNVELRIKSSDCKLHKHSDDKNYNNIVRHVFRLNNVDAGLSFPALE